MNIPDELVVAIAGSNAVLFVGAGLSVGAGLPSWGQLIEPLADRIGLPATQRGDPLKVTQFYETQRGRQALLGTRRVSRIEVQRLTGSGSTTSVEKNQPGSTGVASAGRLAR